ncbi:hypothetical protein NMY22_g19889 [Coprinellus aureogranulatus]|nr:hypothetical protein NMY22_g19889 [Coprinellus aureogranulatus]
MSPRTPRSPITLTPLSMPVAPRVEGWGFDFQWDWGVEEMEKRFEAPDLFVQGKMEQCIDEYLAMIEKEEREDANVSPTQIKKKAMLEEKARRKARYSK